MRYRLLPLLAACLASPAPLLAQDTPADLAKQAKAVLTTHCYRCHGQNGAAEGGFENATDLTKIVEGKKVVPNDPLKSRVFRRINPDLIGDMPADDLTKPTPAEVATLKRWIDAGAPADAAAKLPPRPFFGLEQEVQAIDDFLQNKIDHRKWPTYRFFSLRTLYNAPPELVKDADLTLYRAALAKLLNSLSWKNRIVVPDLVDPAGVVLAVNIEDLDWADGQNRNLWREILKLYPYALTHDRYPEAQGVNNRWRSIVDKTTTDVPVLRADWFIATAARPPLYHTLLQLPATLRELERRIPTGNREYLDIHKNVAEGKVARAGFNGSGVSERNNRLVERHETSWGALWVSYDFKVSAGRGNLFVFPLGPSFADNPFERHAFKHAGGEVIWNLPNGMQGYLLVKDDGGRIDDGPIDIVSDGKKTSGTAAVVNGISCMACHQHGMIHKADQVRDSSVLGGKARDRVRDVYLPAADMERHFDADEKRFLDALTQAVMPFLLAGPNAGKSVKDFAEPITPIAKWYVAQEITLDDAARELGLPTAAPLAGFVQANEELQRHGLLPLATGKTIKREVWESTEFGSSAYQKAARQLKLGTPLTVR